MVSNRLRRVCLALSALLYCTHTPWAIAQTEEPGEDEEHEALVTCATLKIATDMREVVYFDADRAGARDLDALLSQRPAQHYDQYYQEIESASIDFLAQFIVGQAARPLLRGVAKQQLRHLETRQEEVRQVQREMSAIARQLEAAPGINQMTRRELEQLWQLRLREAANRFAGAKFGARFFVGVALIDRYSLPVDLVMHLVTIREPWIGLMQHESVSIRANELLARAARRQAENLRALEDLRREMAELRCFDLPDDRPTGASVLTVDSRVRNTDSEQIVSTGARVLIRVIPDGSLITWSTEDGRKITADATGTPTANYMSERNGDFVALGRMLMRRDLTANPGALLGWVQLETGYNSPYFVVGHGGCFSMPATGRLFLGFNDRWVRNNAGTLAVEVQTNATAEQCARVEAAAANGAGRGTAAPVVEEPVDEGGE